MTAQLVTLIGPLGGSAVDLLQKQVLVSEVGLYQRGLKGEQGVEGPVGDPGATQVATAYEALPAGYFGYIRSDGQIALATSSVEGREAVGFVRQSYSSGAAATLWLIRGVNDQLSGLTPGASYYLGHTPGTIVDSTTAMAYSSGVIAKVGVALSATKLSFYPEHPITL